MTNHILLKFISEEKHLKEFLDGSLYMNSLYYFWNEYPLKEAAKKWDEFIKTHPGVDPKKVSIPINNKLSSAQADMFEGTVGFEMSEILQMDFGEHLLSDAVFRAMHACGSQSNLASLF